MRTSDPVVAQLPGKPVPCPRPRVSKWGSYYPASYKTWRSRVERDLQSQFLPVVEYPCRVFLEVRVAKARTSKLTRPVGDVDNYAKAALDSLQRVGVLTDDVNVVSLSVEKRWAEPGEEEGITAILTEATRPHWLRRTFRRLFGES
ncbi:MAG: RusA family crossover junction endodeoxyribonuclease [Lysobacteraceae bacterium]